MLTKEISNTVLYSFQAAKVPLCLMVAFSSLFGFSYSTSMLIPGSVMVFTGVLLLSCGAATYNSLQERADDALMERTSLRPLVLKRISRRHAIYQAAVLTAAGLLLLLVLGLSAFAAGLGGIVIYNFVYTRMKRETLLAIIPGAVCGSVPAYIGWLAAGGEALSFGALLLAVLMILWQIPHFFLVMLNHKKDYLGSKSPNILRSLNEDGVRRVFLPWLTALATSMISFAVYPANIGTAGRSFIVLNSFLLLMVFYYEMLIRRPPNYKLMFTYLNISIFILMLIVCANAGIANYTI